MICVQPTRLGIIWDSGYCSVTAWESAIFRRWRLSKKWRLVKSGGLKWHRLISRKRSIGSFFRRWSGLFRGMIMPKRKRWVTWGELSKYSSALDGERRAFRIWSEEMTFFHSRSWTPFEAKGNCANWAVVRNCTKYRHRSVVNWSITSSTSLTGWDRFQLR